MLWMSGSQLSCVGPASSATQYGPGRNARASYPKRSLEPVRNVRLASIPRRAAYSKRLSTSS